MSKESSQPALHKDQVEKLSDNSNLASRNNPNNPKWMKEDPNTIDQSWLDSQPNLALDEKELGEDDNEQESGEDKEELGDDVVEVQAMSSTSNVGVAK